MLKRLLLLSLACVSVFAAVRSATAGDREVEWESPGGIPLVQTEPAGGQPTFPECVGPNLLENPSFEGNYSSYVPPNGHPDCPAGVCTTAQMAPDWTPFWQSHNDADDPWVIRMPEYKPAEAVFTNPDRVRSGDRAQQYFTFFSTHNAGFYQQVDVTPGQTYCFSVWGHSWSANDSDDPWSGPDHGLLNQRIGLHPSGSTDWTNGGIVWSGERTQYDIYDTFNVVAAAAGSQMTVFVNSEPTYAVKHNDVYWDDAALVPVTFASPTTSLHFIQVAGSASAQTQNALTYMTGPDNMTWTATVLGGAQMPVSFVSNTGGMNAPVQVQVNGNGLGVGTYNATIRLTPSIALPNTPIDIPVTLAVVSSLDDATYMPAASGSD